MIDRTRRAHGTQASTGLRHRDAPSVPVDVAARANGDASTRSSVDAVVRSDRARSVLPILGDTARDERRAETQRLHPPAPLALGGVHGARQQELHAGKTAVLSGTVINKHPLRINNEGPPAGAYLELDRPLILVDAAGQRLEIRELFLALDEVTQQACGQRGNNCGSCSVADACMVGRKLPDDRHLTVHGRVDTLAFGGGGKAPGLVAGLGGLSVLGQERREPLYKTDKTFRDENGRVLESLLIKNPDVPNPTVQRPAGYRHPDTQLVFASEPTPKSPDRMVVWLGKSGGSADIGKDFHGFGGFHVPRPPTQEERASLLFQDRGPGSRALFTSDLLPKIEKHGALVDLEPLGPALGQTWFLDRSGRKAYGLTMKEAPASGYELAAVVPFKATDFIAGPAPEPPFGYFSNEDGTPPIDGRQLDSSPRAALAAEKRERPIFIPRRVDPTNVDGPGGWYATHIGPGAKHAETAIYAPLAAKTGKDGLVAPDDFKRSLVEIVAATPDGPATIAKIRQVMVDAEKEFRAGRAAEPPLDKKAWFDFLLGSYLHAHDLRVWLKALGFGGNSTEGHDLTEMVPLSDVQWQMKGRYMDPWFVSYVEEEERKGLAAGMKKEEILINCSFLNPNYAAAGYLWGFAALGADSLMNLHRLSCHHSGNTHEEIFWVEKALNFIIHHVPLEDFGVRHEEAGMFSRLVEEGIVKAEELTAPDLGPDKVLALLEKSLQHAMANDPAMKTSEVGKAVIRDAFVVWQTLAARGHVQPWHLARPRPANGDYPTTPKLEASYHQLQLQTRAAKRLFDDALAGSATLSPGGSLADAARAFVGELVALRDGLAPSRVASRASCEAIVNTTMERFRALRALAGDSDEGRSAVDVAARAALALFALPSVFHADAAVAFSAPAPELLGALATPLPANAPSAFLPKEELLRAIAAMDTIPAQAERARARGDGIVAGQLVDIHAHWLGGFLSANPDAV